MKADGYHHGLPSWMSQVPRLSGMDGFAGNKPEAKRSLRVVR
jgi:hypothetical protein